jgi:hypothetical protein
MNEGMWTYHSRELGVTTVGTWLAMSTKTSDLGEVKAELVLKPVYSISRAASEDLD